MTDEQMAYLVRRLNLLEARLEVLQALLVRTQAGLPAEELSALAAAAREGSLQKLAALPLPGATPRSPSGGNGGGPAHPA